MEIWSCRYTLLSSHKALEMFGFVIVDAVPFFMQWKYGLTSSE